MLMSHDSSSSYLAIGTGLDPRQQVLYGRQLGPLLVGLSLGLVSSSTTGIAPGYTGASMNPARALALAIASRNWHRENFLLFLYHREEADRGDLMQHRPLGMVGRTGKSQVSTIITLCASGPQELRARY